jgi:hypothetical protein
VPPSVSAREIAGVGPKFQKINRQDQQVDILSVNINHGRTKGDVGCDDLSEHIARRAVAALEIERVNALI